MGEKTDEEGPEHPVMGILRVNAGTLKRQSGASDAELERRAKGISKKTINNVSNARHNVTVDSLAHFADALRVDTWQLLLEDMPAEQELRDRLTELVVTYLRLGPRGRENIERTAEVEAKSAGVFEELQARFRRARRHALLSRGAGAAG